MPLHRRAGVFSITMAGGRQGAGVACGGEGYP